MPDSPYYDRQGQPMDRDEFTRRFEDMEYRVVGNDTVEGIHVSTVWLGINHNWHGGPPIIFETMMFEDESGDRRWLDFRRRYATEAEALAGHADAVRMVLDAERQGRSAREDLVAPDEDRPLAEPEPGSIDISGLDKAELLAALVNATRLGRYFPSNQLTHEQAAAIIQERLGAGDGPPFNFDYVAGRPIKCDIGGPRISAFHVARYDRDAGEGTIARVVGELRVEYERRRAERVPHEHRSDGSGAVGFAPGLIAHGCECGAIGTSDSPNGPIRWGKP